MAGIYSQPTPNRCKMFLQNEGAAGSAGLNKNSADGCEQKMCQFSEQFL